MPVPSLHCCLAKELNLPVPDPPMVSEHPDSIYLSGMLWLPTFNVLLKSSFETMTVHCLGEERIDDDLLSEKIPHCVLPHETYAPVKGMYSEMPVHELDFPLEMPYSLDCYKKKFKVKIYSINKSSFVYDHSTRAGTNVPTEEEVAVCEVFDCESLADNFTKDDLNKYECVSILVGTGKDEESPVVNCLQMTFHNRNPSSFFKGTRKSSTKSFFKQILKQISGSSTSSTSSVKKSFPKAFEIKRTGGSSGLAEVGDLPKLTGSIPRRLKSAIWIPSADRKVWHYFYIGVDGKCNSREYGPPKLGGKFETSQMKRNGLKTENLFRSFPVMSEFVLVKALSGLILDKLNLHNLCKWKISPLAALAEVHHVSVCRELLREHKLKKKWVGGKKAFFWWTVLYSDKFNRNTVVCHPCGFHFDLFSDQKRASVENKMLFVIPGFGGTGEWGIGGGTGRGGCGPTDFVFAVLDWESQKSNFRATWAEEIYRQRENASNDPPPRLNRQQRMDIYLANPDMQHRLPNPFEAWNS